MEGFQGMVYLIIEQYILITYVITVQNMVRNYSLETWGLGIVDTNHILPQKLSIIMSNQNENSL